jgi:uncharacterized RDD family membrane protein YckC
MNTASFAKRLAAGLIDVVILYTILQLIFFVTFFFAPRDIFSQLFIAVPWILLLQFLYFILFWAFANGATPGMMLLKISIVQTNGSEITFGQSVIRYVGFILSILPLFLGFIWILFDEQNQGWHDKIAKTIVISEEERKRNNKKRP